MPFFGFHLMRNTLLTLLCLCGFSLAVTAQFSSDRISGKPLDGSLSSKFIALNDSIYYLSYDDNWNRILKCNHLDGNAEREISLEFGDSTFYPTSMFQAGNHIFIRARYNNFSYKIIRYRPDIQSFDEVPYYFNNAKLFGDKGDLIFYINTGTLKKFIVYHVDTGLFETYWESNSHFASFDSKSWAFTQRYLFFISDEGGMGREVRCIDRQLIQEYTLKDINPGNSTLNSPQELYTYQGNLYFSAFDGQRYSLWTSDGTSIGTRDIGNFYQPFSIAYPMNMVGFKDKLFFSVRANVDGKDIGYEYHYYDILKDTGELLMDIPDVQYGGALFPWGFYHSNDSLLYLKVQEKQDTFSVWTTDGTKLGTKKWLDKMFLDGMHSLSLEFFPVRKGWIFHNYNYCYWLYPEKNLKYPISSSGNSLFKGAYQIQAIREMIYVMAEKDTFSGYLFRIIPPSTGINNLTLCQLGAAVQVQTGVDSNQLKQKWNTGEESSVKQIQDTGWYWVDFSNQSGDTVYNRDSFYVNLDFNSNFSIGQDSGVQFPYKIAGNKVGKYLWSNGSTDSTISAEFPGVYWAEFTSESGCIYRDSIVLSYPTNVKEVQNHLSVYPNPSSGNLKIHFNIEPGKVTLHLIDASGREVANYHGQGNNINWNPATRPGLYYMIIETERDIYQLKIIRISQ